MKSITARWMIYVQIIFLALSFWIFLFIAPVKADPFMGGKPSSLAMVVVAASLQNQHGPVEYRPAKVQHKTTATFYSSAQREAMKRAAANARYNERSNVSYSGNLWAMNAKP